jgi:hypothetical protein
MHPKSHANCRLTDATSKVARRTEKKYIDAYQAQSKDISGSERSAPPAATTPSIAHFF